MLETVCPPPRSSQNAPYVVAEASVLNLPYVVFSVGGVEELIISNSDYGEKRGELDDGGWMLQAYVPDRYRVAQQAGSP